MFISFTTVHFRPLCMSYASRIDISHWNALLPCVNFPASPLCNSLSQLNICSSLVNLLFVLHALTTLTNLLWLVWLLCSVKWNLRRTLAGLRSKYIYIYIYTPTHSTTTCYKYVHQEKVTITRRQTHIHNTSHRLILSTKRPFRPTCFICSLNDILNSINIIKASFPVLK